MKRIVGLDYLRIIMVFMVFLFHSWMHLDFQLGKLTSFISEGAVYMTMFFMLSGYVLGLKYKHFYLSIVIVVMLLLKMHVPHMSYMSYSAILIPFFCWQLLGHTTVPRKENVIINHLADISYSFFLLQLFVFKFTVDASQCIGHIDVNIQFALALIICLVLASLSHKFIEKPIMSWVKSSMLK